MALKVEVVQAQAHHAAYLAPRMRESDVAEVWASAEYTPLEAIELSLLVSDYARSLFFDGEIAAIWGTCPSHEIAGAGSIWLLGTDLLEEHSAAFLRVCVAEMPPMLERYEQLFNFIDARNTRALRWAEWLGFEISPPIPWGVHQVPFHPIALRRPPCVFQPQS